MSQGPRQSVQVVKVKELAARTYIYICIIVSTSLLLLLVRNLLLEAMHLFLVASCYVH